MGEQLQEVDISMRILHIYDSDVGERALPDQGSGPASVTFYLSKYMAKEGHDVTILERRCNNLPPLEYIEGIRFVRLDAKKRSGAPFKEIRNLPFGLLRLILDSTEFAIKVNNYVKKENFDVVHVHHPFAASILVTLNRELRRRIIYTLHAGEEKKRLGLGPSNKTLLLLRFFSPDLFLIKRVRKTIVLNKALRFKLLSKGIDESRITFIPNGVEIDKSIGRNIREEEERIKRRYKLGNVNILFSGPIIPRKGVKYLIKAIEMLVNGGYNINLVIVGRTDLDEDYVRELREYVKSHKLPINFTGFIPYEDLMRLYYICDIFVLPSFEEGDPMALKSALAAGKPLVGSNVGGIPMQIRDGWNGFLVEPGNEKQLAEKIRYLIDNLEERERMGKNSRKLAREEFDWKKITERYLKVYEEVAE